MQQCHVCSDYDSTSGGHFRCLIKCDHSTSSELRNCKIKFPCGIANFKAARYKGFTCMVEKAGCFTPVKRLARKIVSKFLDGMLNPTALKTVEEYSYHL